MITLGIETSCDETACAVLKGRDEILANVVSSSLQRHKPFGGVVPEIASRHALEAINLVYGETLRKARVKPADIDLISVTQGPGLIGSLFVGVSFAKALSFSLGVPFVGVNHIEAHLEVNFIGKTRPSRFVGLIVSGGHASLVLSTSKGYTLLGETIDDAIGEAYDKVAKILGLGYPGGPVIDRLSRGGNPKVFRFTEPKQDGQYNFSFSGIKTAVLNLYKKESDQFRSVKFRRDFCASFQETVMSWVVQKSFRACENENASALVVGGGVSANSRLRALLDENARARKIKLFIPPFSHTTDNAAMIARLGSRLYKNGLRSNFNMEANPSLRIGTM